MFWTHWLCISPFIAGCGYLRGVKSSNPFDSDTEVPAILSKKKNIKSQKSKKPQRKTQKREDHLFGSGSESETDPAPAHVNKRRKINLFPDSEDDEPEPVRAAILKNFLSRRVASGNTHQSDPTRRGEYYLEVRISNCRELEAITNNRWQRSLISFKTAVNDKTPTWKAVTQLVSAVKEDYKHIKPILYPSKE